MDNEDSGVFTNAEARRLQKLEDIGDAEELQCDDITKIDAFLRDCNFDEAVVSLGFYRTVEGDDFLEAIKDAQDMWRIIRDAN